MRAIHINEARKILDSEEKCDLRVWEISTGEIIEYTGVICFHSYFRGGTRKVRLENGEIRKMRDVCIFEINGIEIYL